jgi:hypothetical protein
MQQLELHVKGGDIIVTMPGPRAAVNLSQFLAAAWRAANDKARELGWIV